MKRKMVYLDELDELKEKFKKATEAFEAFQDSTCFAILYDIIKSMNNLETIEVEQDHNEEVLEMVTEQEQFKVGDEVYVVLPDAQRTNGTNWRIVKEAITKIYDQHPFDNRKIKGYKLEPLRQSIEEEHELHRTYEEAEKALEVLNGKS